MPRLERLDGGAVLERQLDVHGDLEAAADRRRVDVGVVAADHAGALERPHAAQARRGREPDALGQLDVREPPVGLQVAQDCAIEGIHWQIMPQNRLGRARRGNTSAVAIAHYRCGMATAVAATATLVRRRRDRGRGRRLRRLVRRARRGGRPQRGPGLRDVDARVHRRVAVRVRRACSRPAAGALAAIGPAVMLAVRNAAYGLSLAPILPARLRDRALAAQLVIDETHGDGAGPGRPGARRGARSSPPASASGCAGTSARSPARCSAAGSATRARSGSTRCSRPRSSRCWRRSCAGPARPSPRRRRADRASCCCRSRRPGVPVIAALAGVVPGVLRRPGRARVSWTVLLGAGARSPTR